MKRLILIAFSLVNLQAFAGDATLTWTAPTLNTDGSTLTDLAGFTIYLDNQSVYDNWSGFDDARQVRIDLDNPPIDLVMFSI